MTQIKKGTLESMFFFILTPFLSVPLLLYNIRRKNIFSLYLFLLLLGIIGYIYIPTYSNDKTRYLERYILFQNFNFDQFLEFFIVVQKNDIIFDWLIFLFAKLKINIHFLFFALNSFTIFSVFILTERFSSLNKYVNKNYLTCFFLIITQFALQHLYSGIRFTFAAALFYWAVYYLFLDKKKIKGVLFMCLACFVHFSFIYLLLPIICLIIFPRLNYFFIFKISLFFLLIPKQFIEFLMNQFSVLDSYSSKIDLYVNEDDFLTKNFSNISNVIIYYSRNLWVYVAYIFLLFQGKKINNKVILNLVLVFFAFVNVLYALPTVYSRYLIFVKFIFTAFLISNYIKNNNIKYIRFFLILYLISMIVDIWVLRYNFLSSLYNIENLSLFSIFFNQFTINDVIPNAINL